MRLIDADALMDAMRDEEFQTFVPLDEIDSVIDKAPTIDAEPVKHGRWEYGVTLNHEWRKCSVCLVSQDIFGCFTYCPNCGAKMDLEDENRHDE